MTASKRFQMISYEEAGPELRALYDDVMRVMGMPFVLRWFRSQGNNLPLLRGNWEKIKATLYSGDVPFLLKQLIIFNISRERGCKYCSFIHKIAADMLGHELCADSGFVVTEMLDSHHVPSSYKTAIRLITKGAMSPSAFTADDLEELREEGFSDAQIQELMAQADLSVMLNTISDIAGVEIDPELLGLSSTSAP